MTTPQIVSWGGYEFTCYDPSQTDWNDVPGVYIFARLSPDGRWWRAAYVGRTLSFKERLGDSNIRHERWEEARGAGVTHVHARVVYDETERKTLEFMLIDTYDPPMNAKLR